MRRSMLCMLLLGLFVGGIAPAQTIDTGRPTLADLFQQARSRPDIQDAELATAEASAAQEQAAAGLYPKVFGIGRVESYNSPTNLRPLPPTEVNPAKGEAVPFSDTITRYGLVFQMPLYVQPLYTLSRKTAVLLEKANIQRQIELVRKEAAIVSLNSSLYALEGLEAALLSREKSLQETLKTLRIRVDSGKTPESEWMKVDRLILDIQRQRVDVERRKSQVFRDLFQHTGVTLTGSVPMTLVSSIRTAPYPALLAAGKDVDAARFEARRVREQFYPSLSIEGSLLENDGTAYNTDTHVHRSYDSVAVMLKLPLFEKEIWSAGRVAEIREARSRQGYEKLRIELEALDAELERRFPLLDSALRLAEQSVTRAGELLDIARVAYSVERMTTEEYLRYEADVLSAEAERCRSIDDRWQALAQKAVLYGQLLEGIIQ